MITAAKIHKDIARIEALMMLGSKRERSLLATLRQDCFCCLQLINLLSEEVGDKQLKLATTRLNSYDVAMASIRSRWLKNDITEPRKKELETEVLKHYKPDWLRHQIRLTSYILGYAEIISEELLTSMKSVSQTQQYHGKQKGSN